MKRREFCTTAMTVGALGFVPITRAMSSVFSLVGQIQAVSRTGGEIALESAAVTEFGESLQGELLMPDNSAYEVARRVWNGMIDKRPAMIARCRSAQDIVNAVKFAGSNDLLVAVKGGGHSFSGQSTCNGGLMIDCSGMTGIKVDPDLMHASAEPGVLGAQMDRACQAHGQITATGSIGHTGIAGLTLGGGFSRVSRKFGLAIDMLKSVDIVTADGVLRHASAQENPDLFWAVRGGGGNFGVVTRFEFHTGKMDPMVLGGSLIYPMSQAKQVIASLRDYMLAAPDEMDSEFSMRGDPELGAVIEISVCYCGDLQQGEKVAAPLKKLGKIAADTIAPISYVALQVSGDDYVRHGLEYYIKSGFVADLGAPEVNALVDGFPSSPAISVFGTHGGGAAGRVPADATPFVYRSAISMIGIVGAWADAADNNDNIASIRGYYDAIEPHFIGYYVNLNEEQGAKVRSNYGPNYPRLVEVKNKYDPKNLFHLNANVIPTV